VHAVGTPVGGSYGGKDELTDSAHRRPAGLGHAAPVRLHLSRPQSTDLGVKRHPMQIACAPAAMHRAADLHQVQIVADTGAYATHGPEVLDAASNMRPAPTGIWHWTSAPGWPTRTTASPARFAALAPCRCNLRWSSRWTGWPRWSA
jgi:CO/xanthine dehydrogenase Mo-binding subunit